MASQGAVKRAAPGIIKLVLLAIPIFYLSMFKLPEGRWKEFGGLDEKVSLERSHLMGG